MRPCPLPSSPSISALKPTVSTHSQFELHSTPQPCVDSRIMTSQFMEKISSLFHQPADGRALLLSNSHDDSNGAKANESPPPYNSSRGAVITDNKASPTSAFHRDTSRFAHTRPCPSKDSSASLNSQISTSQERRLMLSKVAPRSILEAISNAMVLTKTRHSGTGG